MSLRRIITLKTLQGVRPFNENFSSKPGSYGSGVSNAVESSKWKNENDLADVFIEWMGYSYGKNNFGREAKNELSLVSKI